MKKGLLIVAMMIGVTASAQDFNSKKGTAILPEAGDCSIGIGATSTLNYFGNLLNGSAANAAPSFGWQGATNVISGKYMKDANTAYRVNVRLGFGTTKTSVPDSGLTTTTDTKVASHNVNLGAGIQKYRGKGRVRGFYGAEANIGLGGSKTTVDFTGGSSEDKAGSTFSFGVRGFLGAEYFFAPKMSLSGEFGWGLNLSSTGASESTTTIGGASTTVKGGKSSSFGFETDNAGGSINLNFYF